MTSGRNAPCRFPCEDGDIVRDSIGVYMEKNLHRQLKDYFALETGEKEVRIGPYCADVVRENNIIEIQTGGFFPLKEKIDYYISETDLDVTVVHPIAEKKTVVTLDRDSGAVSRKRRSPKREFPVNALCEIYWLLPYIGCERLCFDLVSLEVTEYRVPLPGKRRRGAAKADTEREIVSILGETVLSDTASYRALLPESLGTLFRAEDFANETGIRGMKLSASLKVLVAAGVIERCGSDGRKYLYRRL